MTELNCDRKFEERELHDALRGGLRDEPKYTTNKKWYSITRRSKDFIKKWLLDRCNGRQVLDYCCGNGEMAIWLAGQGAQAFGIDISPVSIKNAEEEATRRGVEDKVTFVVGDAEGMEFDDDLFDIVVVDGVLHHLDLNRAYAELSRVLKADGEVICTEALRHNPMIHWYRRRTPHLRSAWEVEHILGKREIMRAREYFDHVEVVGWFHMATIMAVPFRGTRLFILSLRMFEALDSILLRVPWVRWWAWMAVFVLAAPKKPSSTQEK